MGAGGQRELAETDHLVERTRRLGDPARLGEQLQVRRRQHVVVDARPVLARAAGENDEQLAPTTVAASRLEWGRVPRAGGCGCDSWNAQVCRANGERGGREDLLKKVDGVLSLVGREGGDVAQRELLQLDHLFGEHLPARRVGGSVCARGQGVRRRRSGRALWRGVSRTCRPKTRAGASSGSW